MLRWCKATDCNEIVTFEDGTAPEGPATRRAVSLAGTPPVSTFAICVVYYALEG